MLNKRKALIGYTVYAVTKPIAKRMMRSKARAVPGGRLGALVAALGALVGGLFFWRRRRVKAEESLQD